MPAATLTDHRKRGSLNLRIKPEERELIVRAAQLRGKNRTDFMLDAVRAAAEAAVLDRIVLTASPEARATMQAVSPWQKA